MLSLCLYVLDHETCSHYNNNFYVSEGELWSHYDLYVLDDEACSHYGVLCVSDRGIRSHYLYESGDDAEDICQWITVHSTSHGPRFWWSFRYIYLLGK